MEPPPPKKRKFGVLQCSPPELGCASASSMGPSPRKSLTPTIAPPPDVPQLILVSSAGRRNSKAKGRTALAEMCEEMPSVGSSKRDGRASSSSGLADQPAPENLQHVMNELFLCNKLSARDVARVARGGKGSGAEGVDRFAAAGGGGKHPQNAARDLMRALLSKTSMPNTTWFDVPCWNPHAMEKHVYKIPSLLPHLAAVKLFAGTTQWKTDVVRAPQIWEAFAKTCQSLGLNPQECLPIGLHGDGVPFTKKQSLEVISWNVLGEPNNDRVPFTGTSKAYCCKCGCQGRCTWDAVMEIFAWSIKALVAGKHPQVDHLGQNLPSELACVAGQSLGVQGVLCQIRGDWPFLKTLFGVPAWNNQQCCWMCEAENDPESEMDFRKPGLNAKWRQARLTTRTFFQKLKAMAMEPSPLFHCPGLVLDHIVLDWLHIVDLGIAQDIAGNVFTMCISPVGLPGSNQAIRLKALWVKILAWYKENKVPVRLDNLTIEMFHSKNGKPSKLKAKGGETRQLIPFLANLSKELASNSEQWNMVARLCQELFECAKLAAAHPFEPERLASASRRLCSLWAALAATQEAQGNYVSWRIKPKFHLFQELCEYKCQTFGSPELFWCYVDESWCGFWSKAAKRRGGSNPVSAVPERLLNRFRAMSA